MTPGSATRTKGLLPIIAGPSITTTTSTTTTNISQRTRLLMMRRRNKTNKDIQYYDRGQPILPSSPSCIPMTEDEAMKIKVKEETVPPVTALEEYDTVDINNNLKYACSEEEEEASLSSYPSLDEENSGVYW